MELRPVPRSPLQVSVVGLGCNNFGRRLDREQTGAVIDAALEAGFTLLDTADVYGSGRSEELIGAALAGRATRGQCRGARRPTCAGSHRSRPDQVRQNARAGAWTPSPGDADAIDAITA